MLLIRPKTLKYGSCTLGAGFEGETGGKDMRLFNELNIRIIWHRGAISSPNFGLFDMSPNQFTNICVWSQLWTQSSVVLQINNEFELLVMEHKNTS